MNLVLIGKKSVAIEELVNKNLDDTRVMRFDTIDTFVQEAQSRHPIIDRIILMQDAYIDLHDLDFTLSNFNDYIQANYPQTRLITLSNNANNAKIMASHFLSPIYAHIHFATVKPTVLLSIITEPIDVVKKKYEKISSSTDIEAVMEVVDDNVGNPQAQNKGSGKKKKGLFGGLFGKKAKGKDVEQREVGYAPMGQGQGVDEFSETEEYDEEILSVDHQYSGIHDGEVGEFEEDITKQYAQEEESEDEEDGDSLQFTMESTVIGEESVDLPNDGDGWADEVDDWTPDTGDGWENPDTGDDWENPETNDGEDDWENPDTGDWENPDETNNSNDNSDVEEGFTFAEPTDNTELPNDEDDIESESFTDKIKELGKQHAVAGENIVIPKVNIPKTGVSVEIETKEVEDDLDVFGDISSMEQQYEEANTKTVVKEKVVEKIVEVNKGNKNNFNYKNGVRLIIVTGDRKTGVTRTALNLATIYAKSEPTLYVDLDVDRHGSLSYLGIEHIIEEPEHIQNGVGHIKHERMLESLTMLNRELGVDCLVSSYDSDVDDEQFREVQSIIAHQKMYKNVIVDCPIEKLFMLEDIIVYSEVLICMEAYTNCVINTIDVLESIEDRKLSALMSRHCGLVITKGKVDALKSVLKNTSEIFDLDSRPVNWARVPISGTIKDLKNIAERL